MTDRYARWIDGALTVSYKVFDVAFSIFQSLFGFHPTASRSSWVWQWLHWNWRGVWLWDPGSKSLGALMMVSFRLFRVIPGPHIETEQVLHLEILQNLWKIVLVRLYFYLRKYPGTFRKMTPFFDVLQMFVFLRNVFLKEQSVVRSALWLKILNAVMVFAVKSAR